MSANDNKKYYWLKLDKGFFKRHDMTIIESMPNGKDYIIFYLKLLCESTSHEGNLRFSDEIPYDLQMLSALTNTNIDIVRSAITIFENLKMIQLLDDGTLYMSQVRKMIGSETGQTIRKREAKEQKNLIEGKEGVKLTLEIDKEKEIDKEIDIIKESVREKMTPTLDEIKDYIYKNNYVVNPNNFYHYYEANGWEKVADWQKTVDYWNSIDLSKGRSIKTRQREEELQQGDLELDAKTEKILDSIYNRL